MSAIRQMSYRPADGSSAPVEVMTFQHLRRLNDGATQRADFYVVGLVSAGEGRAMVDFENICLTARTGLWIPPGAVHRWDDISAVRGHLLLFVPTAPVTGATRDLVAALGLAHSRTISDSDWSLLATGVRHLELEADAVGPDASPAVAEIPQILLSALLARLQPARGIEGGGDLFRRFQWAVETHFRQHHGAGHYARLLGYAPRTLSRAVLSATGATAKAYVTARLVLEAKRMLLHDRCTAARCATELGFHDASNFSTFFLNATGERPGSWQRAAVGVRGHG